MKKFYNVVRNEKRTSLDKLKEYKRGRVAYTNIMISNWHNWIKSFWISIKW